MRADSRRIKTLGGDPLPAETRSAEGERRGVAAGAGRSRQGRLATTVAETTRGAGRRASTMAEATRGAGCRAASHISQILVGIVFIM